MTKSVMAGQSRKTPQREEQHRHAIQREKLRFGVSAPIRVPSPAAGRMAVTRFIMTSVMERKSLH
jgi:hypothetical protein